MVTSAVVAAPRSSHADKPDLVPPPRWVEPFELDGAARPAARPVGGVEHVLVDVQLRVGPGVRDRSLRYVRRVASPEGLDAVSPIALDFDPTFQRLQVHHVRLWREGKSIDAYRAADVKMLDVEDDLHDRILEGRRRMVIVVPDLRVGDAVDVAYTLSGANPIFAGHTVDHVWLGGPGLERLRARIRVEPGGRPVDVHVRGSAPAPVRRERGGAIEYAWDMAGARSIEDEDEDRVPGWFEPYPVAELSDFRDWREVVAWALPLYAPSSPSPEMSAAIAEWRAQPAAERVLAALRFIQDDVRYLGLELGVNSHRPHEPRQVFAQRFGDCKDKSYLLVTVLRAMGIDAHVALVDTDRRARVAAMPPTPLAFDHVIVRAELDGRIYWLDPTWSFQGGTLDTQVDLPYRRALVVRPGSGSFDDIPEPVPAAPLLETNELYRVARDGTATLDVRTIFRHLEADRARSRWTRDPPDQLGKRSLDFYARSQPTIRQARPPVIVDDRRRNEVTVDERYVIAAFWKDGRVRLGPHTLGDLLEPPRVRRRHRPLAVDHPARVEHHIDVELPALRDIQPMDEAIDRDGISYRGRVAQSGLVVSMRYSLATTVADIEPANVDRHLATLAAVDDTLGYELVNGPWKPGSRTTSSGVVVWLFIVGLVMGAVLMVARRARSRPASFRRRAAWGPGEQASSPIEIARPDDLGQAGACTRCSCGGARVRASVETLPQEVRLGELHLLSARFVCQRCGSAEFLYFRIRS